MVIFHLQETGRVRVCVCICVCVFSLCLHLLFTPLSFSACVKVPAARTPSQTPFHPDFRGMGSVLAPPGVIWSPLPPLV